MIDIDYKHIYGVPPDQLPIAYVIARLVEQSTVRTDKVDLTKMTLQELYMLRDGINARGRMASYTPTQNECFRLAKKCAIEISKRPWKEVLAAMRGGAC